MACFVLVPCPGDSCTKVYTAEKSASPKVTSESACFRIFVKSGVAGLAWAPAGRGVRTAIAHARHINRNIRTALVRGGKLMQLLVIRPARRPPGLSSGPLAQGS